MQRASEMEDRLAEIQRQRLPSLMNRDPVAELESQVERVNEEPARPPS